MGNVNGRLFAGVLKNSLLLTATAGLLAASDALIRASGDGDGDTVRTLLAEGADPNTRGPSGVNALMAAALGGHADVIELLLNGGADVDAADNDGATALMAAAESGHGDAVRLLLATRSRPGTEGSQNRLGRAHVGRLQWTRRKRGRVDSRRAPRWTVQGNAGKTPLSLAAQQGHASVVAKLLAAGAELDTPDRKIGWTALMHAAREGHEDVVRVAHPKGRARR